MRNFTIGGKILAELQNGMKFDSYKSLCDFTGIKFDKHKSFLISRIHKICNTHIEDDKIIIDKVFGKVEDIKYHSKDYLYNIGDIVQTKSGNIKIIKKTKLYSSSVKGYQYICMADGYIGENTEVHIKNGIGCPVCGKVKCIDGINSIYDTRKDLLKYIVHKSDAHKYTSCSGKKILCKCPICDYTKMVAISNLSSHGFSCNFCSDGISYPNKFMYCLLNQLKIHYIPEKIFSWCTNKLYDIYIPSLNTIIENHGKQHYIKSFESLWGRTLDEEKENDLFKYNIAKENGISHYIIIDCSESNLEYIKNSIINTDLPLLLQFSENDIDWNLCHNYALKPIVKEVCEYWESHYKNITCTKDHFKMDIHTIMEYLEKGSKVGYCSYIKGYSDSKSLATKQVNSKPIYNVENNIYFFSCNECEEYFKSRFNDKTFSGRGLYVYINNYKKYHNNTFVYINKHEYNKQKLLYEKGKSQIIVIGDLYLERYIK